MLEWLNNHIGTDWATYLGVLLGVRLENGKYPTLRMFFIQIEVRCPSPPTVLSQLTSRYP
ncbi:hypothetical protein ES756_08640 [Salmonella enterica]|nr:hypothetical protein [Salmonella enterica]